MQKFYAHTKKRPDGSLCNQSKWEPLFSENCATLEGEACEACKKLDPQHGHLNKVAYLCSKFAAEMFPADSKDRKLAAEWGKLAGFWHDLGKFAPEWQEYLRNKSDPHNDEIAGKVDHSTAGAQHSVKAHFLYGHLLAYGIAAHHCGLLDVKTNGRACQEMRLLKKEIANFNNAPSKVAQLKMPDPPAFLLKALKEARDGFSAAFFTRLLFSCLVDADFLATEAFMSPEVVSIRNAIPDNVLEKMNELVAAKISSFGTPARDDIVNQQRTKVAEDCIESASKPPGIFTLTVPTGGGKTISSLRFGLEHALKHGQKRIIYVVPFTSIIEQNAEVIRKIIGPLQSDSFTPLIEHHTSLSPDKETEQSRLASENWDAPLVITTAVQFFESLFAAKTSRCRKLHSIANAVVILDEAQTLPVNYLSPCLRASQELSDYYNTTLVLCTATQPAITYNPIEFPIGLKNCREIIQKPQLLFDALKRVEIINIGEQNDDELAEHILESEKTLCIVNRRKHAKELFRKLPEDSGRFHLSALMCPEHRTQTLRKVCKCLKNGKTVRLISTQLIEAGVDVDFPVVYRALAGLDSIAQAAGRCNRSGLMSTPGQTYIFIPEDQSAEVYFRETAQVAAQIVDLYDDLLGQNAIHHYFDLYYYQQKIRWDKKDILNQFRLEGRPEYKQCPFRFNFRTVAENFKLIETIQISVVIPFDDDAVKLIEHLKDKFKPVSKNLLRGLQRYTVQIRPELFVKNAKAFESLRDGQFHVLISTKLNYSQEFGLILDEDYSSNQTLVC